MRTLVAFTVITLGILTPSISSNSTDSRIVNGQYAAEGQFPYQVSLLETKNDGQTTICGGSLIGREWVLTAAHCLQSISYVTVRLGSIRRNSGEVSYVIPAKDVIPHPNYKPQEYHDDIALIKIPPVTYTNRILPVRLPRLNDQSTYAGQYGVIIGWGRTGDDQPPVEYLRYAVVPIISDQQCAPQLTVAPNIICTSSQRSGACWGDSGGPLILQTNSELIGVTAVLFDGCQSGKPNGYTRVTRYLYWIRDNTGISY